MGMEKIVLLALLAAGGAQSAPERPDVVVIVSDDQRADTIAALGNPRIRTPNLDGLAREGAAFRNAYCMGSMQGAVCVPSRAMFLSGHSLFRVKENLADVDTWPRAFERAGYATFAAGKWHNGAPSFARAFPSASGPVFFGGMGNQFKVKVQDFDPAGRYPRERVRTAEGYSTATFTDAVVGFLRSAPKDKPVFAYLSFTVPHDPRTPPEPLYEADAMALPANFLPAHPFDNGELEVRDEKLLPRPRDPVAVKRELAAYYSMITEMDAQVGRVLKALEESGRRKRTIVAFFGDHGLALGSHGLLGKQNLYEHSMKAPLLLAGPGVPAGARVEAPCYLFDVLPTVADLAGVPPLGGIDGRSFRPELGGTGGGREAVLCAYRDVQRSVRRGRWKLIRYPKAGRVQLFDLEADPEETRDLSADSTHAGRLAELSELLAAEQRRWSDPLAP
jgi:arylsulfatase A-like enzyme